jgi:hypothetical protein
MKKFQFRVLYRQFLFRVIDLELLSTSAKGDVSKLLGQFGALLIYVSILIAFAGLVFGDAKMTPAQRLAVTWEMEHFLIATTMLIVGVFAVLSWDSTFPDRRDVLVIAPLPVRMSTLFLAKIAAMATALSLSIAALHSFAGLVWPFVFAAPNGGMLGLIRAFAAYWITVLSAGAFIFCALLLLQGLTALLPRQLFLRMSGILQLGAFCLILCVYFLQPSLVTPAALTAPQNQQALAWLPSYWFLGFFQAINGTMHPALIPLARRAAAGLAIAGLGTAVVFLLSYFRTLQRIIEEPDIAPGARGGRWLPHFGDRPVTALVQFNIRGLFRSRQHRLILSFFMGLAFTIVILYLKTPTVQEAFAAAGAGSPWHEANVPVLVSSIVMMCFAVIGMRVVFAMPTDLRANWIFRMAFGRGIPDCLKATRRTLFALAVLPVWLIWVVVLLHLWLRTSAVGHLIVLGLVGTILVEACLYNFHKIPFTCSYLPGKSNIYYLFFAYTMLSVYVLNGAARLERTALQNKNRYIVMLAVLTATAVLLRWRTASLAREDGAELRFEELEKPAVLELGLH